MIGAQNAQGTLSTSSPLHQPTQLCPSSPFPMFQMPRLISISGELTLKGETRLTDEIRRQSSSPATTMWWRGGGGGLRGGRQAKGPLSGGYFFAGNPRVLTDYEVGKCVHETCLRVAFRWHFSILENTCMIPICVK